MVFSDGRKFFFFFSTDELTCLTWLKQMNLPDVFLQIDMIGRYDQSSIQEAQNVQCCSRPIRTEYSTKTCSKVNSSTRRSVNRMFLLTFRRSWWTCCFVDARFQTSSMTRWSSTRETEISPCWRGSESAATSDCCLYTSITTYARWDNYFCKKVFCNLSVQKKRLVNTRLASTSLFIPSRVHETPPPGPLVVRCIETLYTRF